MLYYEKLVFLCVLLIFFLQCSDKRFNYNDDLLEIDTALSISSVKFLKGNFENTYSNYDDAFSDNTSGLDVDLSTWIEIVFSKGVNTSSVITEVRESYDRGGNVKSGATLFMRRTHIGSNIVDISKPQNIVILKIVQWLDGNKRLIVKPLNQHYSGSKPGSENYFGTKPNSTYSITLTHNIKDFSGNSLGPGLSNSFNYKTVDVDWGFYFMTKKMDDGYSYSEKYIPGRKSDYYNPGLKTILWTHGYEKNSTRDDCKRENFLYHIPEGEGGPWQGHDVIQYVIDDGWNFAVFFWNQFADEPGNVKDCEAKIWNALKLGGTAINGRYGTRYNTHIDYGVNKFIEVDDPHYNGPIDSIAVEFYKQYLSLMKNNLENKRIIGHSNGAQLIIPVVWLISKNSHNGEIPDNYRANRIVLQEGFWSNGEKSYLSKSVNELWGLPELIDTEKALNIFIDDIKTWSPELAIEQNKFQGRLCGDNFPFIAARNYNMRKKTCLKYIYPAWIRDDGFNTKFRHFYGKNYYFWTYNESIHNNITRNGGITSRTDDSIILKFMNNGVNNKVFKQFDSNIDDGNNMKTPFPGDDEFIRVELGNY